MAYLRNHSNIHLEGPMRVTDFQPKTETENSLLCDIMAEVKRKMDMQWRTL